MKTLTREDAKNILSQRGTDVQKVSDMVVPYNGDNSFIFISYSHKDKSKVMPILNSMSRDNYLFWFDEGIDPGTEWDQNIARHIEKSGYFLAFISNNYLDSDNCKDELNYARDLNKKRVLIYLEPVVLPAGMAMRLNRLQAIHHYTYVTLESFLEKLYDSKDINQFHNEPRALFNNPELSNISELTIGACKKFAEGVPEYQFLFLSGWNYKRKKILLSGITEILAERQIVFELIHMEHFADKLVDALVNCNIIAFQKKYEEIPVLILDGIESIAGKEATQEEIYRYIRKRFYANKPTLIIAPQRLDNYKFDKRILELLSNWIIISA